MQNRIREIREKQKMSQSQLAEKAGLHRTLIVKVEKIEDFSQCDVRLKTLIKIADGLGVDLIDILGIEPKEVQKRINRFDKKRITILKNIAKSMQVKIKIEDE